MVPNNNKGKKARQKCNLITKHQTLEQDFKDIQRLVLLAKCLHSVYVHFLRRCVYLWANALKSSFAHLLIGRFYMILFLKHMDSDSALGHTIRQQLHAVGQGYSGEDMVKSNQTLQAILSTSDRTQRQAFTIKTSVQCHEISHGYDHIQHVAHSKNICRSTSCSLCNAFQVFQSGSSSASARGSCQWPGK